MRFSTKLLPSRSSNLGILQLNYPQALHALTLDMIHAMHDVLAEWHKDDTLKAILVTSSESKRPAFCAGGDVKAVYEEGLVEPTKHGKGTPGLLTSDFFRYEYQVNHSIATWNKPQISLWDGVVMGGGVGISIHGKYRVSTEKTLWSMPETGIGLFPDVGSTYWMPRILRGGLAPYLGLTGKRLGASDLLYSGMATHYVPSERLEDLQAALVEASVNKEDNFDTDVNNSNNVDVIAPVLMSFHETPPTDPSDSFLAQNRKAIDDVFGNATRVEDIVAKLQQLDTEFGKDSLDKLMKMSPTSMKITLEGIRRGSQLSTIGECLQMEFRIGQGCMRDGSDFYRGVQAVLVDKDHNPEWKPSTLEEVTDDAVQKYFEPLGENEWEIPPSENQSKL